MKRNIRIKTPLGPDVLLFQQMAGHEALSTPFEYKVQLLSPKTDLDLSALLGQTATVEVDQRAGGTRYFNGYVTNFSFVGSYQGADTPPLGRYEMTLRPWLWLLSLGSNCRIFQKETVPDIVKGIWRQHGFSDFRESLTASYRTWEYSVQYRESDFNYTTRLLEQEGIYFYFEHVDGKHTLVLADAPSAHKPAPEYANVPFFAGEHGANRDHLSTWSVGRQVRPGAYVTTDYDFTNPRADLSAKLQKPASHKQAAFEVYDYPGEYLTSQEGETQARIRLEEHQTDHQVVTTSGNAMGLSVGARFSLTGHPRADQNKEHLVVSASYRLETSAYHTGGDGGDEFAGSYTLIPSQHPYRAPANTPKPRVEGPQTARVVGKKGEEIWTDKHGRIKVQFHWDRAGKKDENSSCWVRVAHQWAGARFGGVFVPRIGQEVVVDFLEGDPDRPLVVGRVYNQDNMPPYDLPGSQTQSGIKSRSSKGGSQDNFNEIRFEDLKGAEELFIQAERNRTIVVKNDESHSVGHDRTIEIENDETVTVGNNCTVEVGGTSSISVAKNRSLNVEGNRTAEVTGNDNLKAGRGVVIEAGDQITFKTGSSTLTLKKDGTIVLKGKNITFQGKDITAKGSGNVKLQ